MQSVLYKVHDVGSQRGEVYELAKKVLHVPKDVVDDEVHVRSLGLVAPVFLESPRRIEAMLFLYFASLMIVGLIERNLRKNMKKENIEKLPILPSRMKTQTPTWNNLNNFFRNVHLSIISQKQKILSAAINGLTDLHCDILRLLGVPKFVYRNLKDRWWLFAPD